MNNTGNIKFEINSEGDQAVSAVSVVNVMRSGRLNKVDVEAAHRDKVNALFAKVKQGVIEKLNLKVVRHFTINPTFKTFSYYDNYQGKLDHKAEQQGDLEELLSEGGIEQILMS